MCDKNIHRGEFRLRIITTNSCDKNCFFCLNDFQIEKAPAKFINYETTIDAIKTYSNFMNRKEELPIVTFSGGEPGLHPQLGSMIATAKYLGAIVKVVTNGLALSQKLLDWVDNWHVGIMDEQSFDSYNRKKNIQVQKVVTFETIPDELEKLILFYIPKIKVKLFENFHEEPNWTGDLIQYMIWKYPNHVTTRFTGKQINRGEGCLSCEKKCITLKALWMFPDNTVSACPQSNHRLNLNNCQLEKEIERAYCFHKWRET